jgi:hypothetical protein
MRSLLRGNIYINHSSFVCIEAIVRRSSNGSRTRPKSAPNPSPILASRRILRSQGESIRSRSDGVSGTRGPRGSGEDQPWLGWVLAPVFTGGQRIARGLVAGCVRRASRICGGLDICGETEGVKRAAE